MEKRFVSFVVLSALILIGWTFLTRRFFPPSPAPLSAPAEPTTGAGSAPAERPPLEAPPTDSAPAATTTAVAGTSDEEIRMETDLVEVVVTNAGGRVRSWRLKEYSTAARRVEFVSRAAANAGVLPLSLVFDDRGILPDANRALYQATRATEPDGAESVTFRWADGAGSSIEKTLVLRRGSPIAEIEIRAVDRGRPVTPRVIWGPGLEVEDEEERSNTYYADQAVMLDGDEVHRIARRKVDNAIVQPESARLGWAGLEDQYFAAVFIPAGSRAAVTIAPLAQSGLTPNVSSPPPAPHDAGFQLPAGSTV